MCRNKISDKYISKFHHKQESPGITGRQCKCVGYSVSWELALVVMSALPPMIAAAYCNTTLMARLLKKVRSGLRCLPTPCHPLRPLCSRRCARLWTFDGTESVIGHAIVRPSPSQSSKEMDAAGQAANEAISSHRTVVAFVHSTAHFVWVNKVWQEGCLYASGQQNTNPCRSFPFSLTSAICLWEVPPKR